MERSPILLARQGNSGLQTLLNDLSNPFQTQLAATSIWIALGTSTGAMVVIGLFFSIVRPHNNVVYAPKIKYADKKHSPPPIGKGLFAWIDPIIKTKESDLVDKIGLDAVIFLRFIRMCRNIFIFLTVIGCAVLIPVHILLSNRANVPKPSADVSASALALSLMTPQYLQGAPLWSHVAISYLFDAVVLYFLWTNYRAVLNLRRGFFQSDDYQQSLHARSIWMIDIPAADRSDEGILRIADSIEHTAIAPRAAVGRNVKELPELIEEHDDAVRKLESILAKYLKNPDKLPAKRPTIRPSKKDKQANHDSKVDAIDYLTGRIRELEVLIKEVRASIDKRNPMPYGFATYEYIEEAHNVAYLARNKHPAGVTVQLAPKPNDLIWKNVPLLKGARSRKRFIKNIWVSLLTLMWIAPNALIAIFLVNLSNLAQVWPAFQTSFNGHPNLWAIVQAIAAPGLTSLVYLVLPIIFRRLNGRAGIMTKTSREHKVTHGLYAFFVFNNLIVFSIFSAIWKFVSAVRADDKAPNLWAAIEANNLSERIVTALCTVSPFWITWLLQRTLGAAADLAQIINLTWIWFSRTFLSPTPRQTIEWTAPPPFDYATYYNYFLFYATVALCYATLQPLVLPVTLVYFAIDAWLKKYLLLYVFITKTESGGQFWNCLFNRVLFATALANCVAALVIGGLEGGWTMIICMAPLLLILLAFKIYTMKTLELQYRYYSQGLLKDPEPLGEAGKKSRRNERVGVKFGNPALYKPLITPMVHAKAQHVLADIYRGRLDSDADADSMNAYSDIAMRPMSNREPGKAAGLGLGLGSGGTGADMFEVVPESNLDFAYYKNRPDFGDEHGGDGELYGKPADLVSERSHTPASFMTGHSMRHPFNRSDTHGSHGSHGTHTPMSGRQQTFHDFEQQHPAYREPEYQRPPVDPTGMYTLRNDSARGLLGAAQPVGYAPGQYNPVGNGPVGYAPVGNAPVGGISAIQTDGHSQQFNLDRWRTPGPGYVGLPAANDDEEPLEYEAYRRGA